MTTEMIIDLLKLQGLDITFSKAEKLSSAINRELSAINEAMKAAHLPWKGKIEKIEKIENDVSWKFTFIIESNHFIN